MKKHRSWVVVAYFTYLLAGLGLAWYRWLGLNPAECATIAQHFAKREVNLMEKLVIAAFTPAQLLFNGIGDIVGLVSLFLFKLWQGHPFDARVGVGRFADSTTVFCARTSYQTIVGHFNSESANRQMVSKINHYLSNFPESSKYKWGSVEEGMKLAKQFNIHQKMVLSAQRDYKDAETRVKNLIDYASQAMDEVFVNDIFQSAMNAHNKQMESLPIIQPDRIAGYVLTPSFEDELNSVGLKASDLHHQVALAFSKQFQVLEEMLHQNDDYIKMLKAMDFITKCPMVVGSIINANSGELRSMLATKANVKDLLLRFKEAASKMVSSSVDVLANSGNIQDMLFYTASIVLNDLPTIKQLSVLHSPTNYAQLELGAAVVKPGTSPSVNRADVASVENMLLQSSTAKRNFNIPMLFDPRNAITPGTDFEEPWLMKSSSGTLKIRLFQPILPSFFALLTPSLTQEALPLSYPKDIEIWGSSRTISPFLLAKHTHQLDGNHFDMINVQIFSNHGFPNYTKIYQFAVYGYPNLKKPVAN
ncbi:Secreted beta-glucosidase sun1 [Massospora cicadina]|nr:Secreted beta-glucosidase sun1 [Massospora cicadina]